MCTHMCIHESAVHINTYNPTATSQALSPYAHDPESRSTGTPRRLKAATLAASPASPLGTTPPPRDRSPDTGLTIRTPRGLGQEAWDRRHGL